MIDFNLSDEQKQLRDLARESLGLATLCVSGGMGMTLLLERV